MYKRFFVNYVNFVKECSKKPLKKTLVENEPLSREYRGNIESISRFSRAGACVARAATLCACRALFP